MNQNIYKQLRALGYEGAGPEIWSEWLTDEGAIDHNSIPEKEYEWLGLQGHTEQSLPMRWRAFFISEGLSGNIQTDALQWTVPTPTP